MMAIWRGSVIAEADKDDLIYIEGKWYFPPDSIKDDYLRASDTPYNCPWKGDCQYFDVGAGAQWSKDSAFSYPTPLPSAIETLHKDFSNYVAFWRDVQVVDE
jgi:uncharacterized protein (DUF427 family)